MKVVTAKQRKAQARRRWVKKLEKLHASLGGHGITTPAEQLIREGRER
jgi:hypothetical protein